MQSKDYYSLSPGSNGEVSQRDIQCLNCAGTSIGHGVAKCRKTTHHAGHGILKSQRGV